MPLEESEMARVFDLGCILFLKKMQNSKFYSYQEMRKLILENSVHRPRLETVEAVIQSQYAIGKLRAKKKYGERYYSKAESH